MKHNFHFPTLVRGIVMAALMASFAATASSRVYAQVTVYPIQYNGYYNPYGQVPYAGYGDPANSPRARSSMFPSQGTVVNRLYQYSGNANYSGYGNVPSYYGNRVQSGNSSYVRTYGGTSYYQPYPGAVYVPYGY